MCLSSEFGYQSYSRSRFVWAGVFIQQQQRVPQSCTTGYNMTVHVQIKKAFNSYELWHGIHGSFGTMISRWFTYQAKSSTCSRKCHLVWVLLPPPTIPKTNNSCIFYSNTGQRGIHAHNITERGPSPHRPVEHDVRSGPVSSPPELRLFWYFY